MNCEILAQLYLLKSFVKIIQSVQTIPYRNNDIRQQACVGLIFRLSQTLPPSIISESLSLVDENDLLMDHNIFENLMNSLFTSENLKNINGDLFEILFIQRAFNKKDKFSGEVALPGGKCDGNETDLEAIVREIKEEIGSDVANQKNKIKYLGKFNKNFYLFPTMSCSLAVFFDFGRNELLVNPNEVQNFKWVPALTLIKIQRNLIGYRDASFSYLIRMYSKLLPEFVKREMEKYYATSSWVHYEIGMKDKLWGTTLHMLMYMLEIFALSVKKCQNGDLRRYFQKENIWENLMFFIEAIEFIKMKFTKDAPKEVEFMGKLFDMEWKMHMHEKFGFESIENAGEIKEKMSFVLQYILNLMMIKAFLPKF